MDREMVATFEDIAFSKKPPKLNAAFNTDAWLDFERAQPCNRPNYVYIDGENVIATMLGFPFRSMPGFAAFPTYWQIVKAVFSTVPRLRKLKDAHYILYCKTKAIQKSGSGGVFTNQVIHVPCNMAPGSNCLGDEIDDALCFSAAYARALTQKDARVFLVSNDKMRWLPKWLVDPRKSRLTRLEFDRDFSPEIIEYVVNDNTLLNRAAELVRSDASVDDRAVSTPFASATSTNAANGADWDDWGHDGHDDGQDDGQNDGRGEGRKSRTSLLDDWEDGWRDENAYGENGKYIGRGVGGPTASVFVTCATAIIVTAALAMRPLFG